MTIFAPITSIGKSGVIVLRVSGQQALFCLKHLGVKISSIFPNQTKLHKIFDPTDKSLIDSCLVTFFKAPHSFTGEDVVELAIHGSQFILTKLINILSKIENTRPAEAGEFSKIAFYNGKMDLVEAEALADLISSKTASQHQQALTNLSGSLSNLYERWRFDMIEILANIEALIDFPDEEIPQNLIIKVNDLVNKLSAEISEHLVDNRGEKIKNGLSLAIIGPPNVGKSSMLNYLANNEIAIISDIAGTTRDVVQCYLEIASMEITVFDTAGIRKVTDKIEQQGIRKSFSKHQNCDIKILMFDQNSNIEEFMAEHEIKLDQDSLLIINKCDINLSAKKEDYLNISIKKNINLDKLMDNLEQKVKNFSNPENSPLFTQARYRAHLQNIIEILTDFSLERDVELVAEDIRIASREIEKITGRINVDDVLDQVFSSFCIGK